MKISRSVFIMLFSLVMIGCAADFGSLHQGAIVLDSDDASAEDRTLEPVDEENDSDVRAGTDASKENEEITVFICGAVNNPGVYTFMGGGRIVDAIEAAGGFDSDAAIDSVNQAELMTDSQMIRILTMSEQQEIKALDTEEDSANDGLVDINSADSAKLKTLPGIGDAKAAAIIAYRDSNGEFTVKEDLMKIPGIKSGVYDQIKDLIKV